MRSRPFVLLSTVLAILTLEMQSQSNSQPQGNSNDPQKNPPVLKTTTRAVIVDVVITDSSGASVGGLQQRDFFLLENGKTQSINFFEEHTATTAPAVTLPELPPHVYSNQPTVAPNEAVNVLLLDSLDTEEADQAYSHKQIVGFLGSLQPGMRVAIYTLNTRLRLLQGFTSDRTLLRAAADSKAAAPGKTIVSRGREDELSDKESISSAGDPQAALAEARSLREYANSQQSRSASMTLTALQQLARALEAIPGRKNLIWFASKFPLALFPEGDNRAALQAFQGHELPEALRETVNMLTRSRVALYPVSARGSMDDRTMNADSGGPSTGDNFNANPYQESSAIRATTATMDQLATDTGGRAIYTTNDVGAVLARHIQNGSHYYTLSYTPPNDKMDGSFRRIEVKLTESKYKLAYRRGYFADPVPAVAQAPSDPLVPLMANGLPDSTQIVYRVSLTAEAQPSPTAPRAGGNAKLVGPVTRYKLLFQIPRDSVSFTTSSPGSHEARLRVDIVAYGRDSKPMNWTGGAMSLSLNDAQFARAQQNGIAAPMEIDLPVAELSLATGIWDMNAQQAGTMQIPISPKADAIVQPVSQ